ncbi:GNAT family N-acetyltransferase [Sphingomonas sp. GM_Shp_1]|uniref:GNAT family N-acetyltransferase n=1 Tax=Sphingomonas sp. GM_Shp_1 TaxID=2937381 RepID=UPI00226B3238|nr:GNAT family N-acetyltransferase [Sphingomonas sp. GM_Shp_1]
MPRLLDHRPDLQTERLSLRRPADRDVDAIVNAVGVWDVARRLARVPYPYTPDDARFFLERIVPAEWVWAITLRGSDHLAGVVGLTPQEHADTAELGYWLAPAHWGHGLMTEAARAVIAFGFDHLGLPALTSEYFDDNPASGRVLAKLGFVETGRILRPCVAIGGDVRAVRMILERPTAWTAPD